MADSRLRLTVQRRQLLLAGVGALLAPSVAQAFGQEGAFHPRVLTTGGVRWEGPRAAAPGRWAWELVRRTSAPARLVPGQIGADDPRLLSDPLAIWAGDAEVPSLALPEISGLRRFLDLGGVLIVDDSDPAKGARPRPRRSSRARR